ncbi:MAG: hypothetical protein ABII12_04875 [Planctomycetota bacterium]
MNSTKMRIKSIPQLPDIMTTAMRAYLKRRKPQTVTCLLATSTE